MNMMSEDDDSSSNDSSTSTKSFDCLPEASCSGPVPAVITPELVLEAARRQGCIINRPTIKKINALFNITIESSDEDEDSFLTHERKITNSCKKNKEKLFNKDKQAVSSTPRRETYTVDSPSPKIQTKKNDQDSREKNRKSKRKVSFVTPLRRSTRISAATPQYNSVKDRPKTPMPSRLSSASKRGSFPMKKLDVACNLNLNISENNGTKISGGRKKRPSTPMPPSKQNRRKTSSLSDSENHVISTGFDSTPKVVPALKELKEEDSNEVSLLSSVDQSALKKTSGKMLDTPSASKEIKEEKIDISCASVEIKEEKLDTLSASKEIKEEELETPCAFNKTSENRLDTSENDVNKKAISVSPPSKRDVAVQTPSLRRTSRGNAKNTPYFTPHSLRKTPILTPGFKRIPDRNLEKSMSSLRSTSKKPIITPGSRRVGTPALSSKKKCTPNFRKIHQKNFDKMESIDDYQKRKVQKAQNILQEQRKQRTPAKSKVSEESVNEKKTKRVPKTYGGIPFVPAAPSTRSKKNQFMKSSGSKTTTAPSVKSKPVNENSSTKKLNNAGNLKMMKPSLKKKTKFDLKASLAKKLPYKPHTGPLKPLTGGNMNSSMNVPSSRPVKNTEAENQVIKANRIQSRRVLQGVRQNKRFLLQMANRQMDMSMQ